MILFLPAFSQEGHTILLNSGDMLVPVVDKGMLYQNGRHRVNHKYFSKDTPIQNTTNASRKGVAVPDLEQNKST